MKFVLEKIPWIVFKIHISIDLGLIFRKWNPKEESKRYELDETWFMENTTKCFSVSEINCQKVKYVEIYNSREEDIHFYIFHEVFRFDKILRYEILLHIGI